MRTTTVWANALSVVATTALLCSCGEVPPAVLLQPSTAAAQEASASDTTLLGGLSPPQIELLDSSERSLSYRATYADGSTQEVRYEFEPNQRHLISAEERAAARAAGTNIYRVQIFQTPFENGSATLRLEYFVPYDEMPPDVRERFGPEAALNWPALLGIATANAQAAQTEGLTVIERQTVQESTEQAFTQLAETVGRGQSLVAAASALLDVNDALTIQSETDAWMKQLAALEDCAKNPTHKVPVPPEELARTLNTLARIRAELKQVTMFRILAIVADYPLGLLQKTGGPVAGLAGAALSVALKPFSTWSDEALKSYIENTLMREAAASVVPCTEECEDDEEAAPDAAAVPSTARPAAPGGARPAATRPTGAGAAPPGPAPAAVASVDAQPPAPAKRCLQNRVEVRLRQVDRFFDLSGTGYFDHRLSFWGTTTVEPSPFGELEGTGTALFRESEDAAVFDWCRRRLRGAVDATMSVRVLPDRGEVQVLINSDRLYPSFELEERVPENPQCNLGRGFEQGPKLSLSCTFSDVDIENGGFYFDPENFVYTDEDDDQLYQCTLRLGGPEPDPPPREPDPPPPPSPRGGGAIGGGQTNSAPGAGGAAGAVAGAMAPAVAPAQSSASAEQGGVYRATLLGARATSPTLDTIGDGDGRGDEVYAAAAAILWDRAASSVLGARLTRTQVYREMVANSVAPPGFDARRPAAQAPTNESMPLLVWEGRLTPAVDAVIIVPSLWERDADSRVFDAYAARWQDAARAMLAAEPVLVAQLASPFLTPATAAGSAIAALPTTNGEDRPIGIGTPAEGTAAYGDSYVVVTAEKVAHLQIGEGTTLQLPLRDGDAERLGGDYTLFLKVERIQ